MTPIPGFSDYFATKDGRIWSRITKRYLALNTTDKKGRYRVCLRKNGEYYWRLVHRLILETFVGPCPDGMECCHYNGNPGDNRLENLRWDTNKANKQDAIRHDTFARGEKSGRAKLNNLQVRIIRQLLNFKSLSQTKIGKIFNVDQNLISYINCNKIWKNV